MHERVQRAQGDGARRAPRAAPDIVRDVVRSPGKPLDPVNRCFMESRFGVDFGNVRVHDDAKARSSLDAVDARAYAAGSHVVLPHARPTRPSERHTLAHELTHVVQQRGADASGDLTMGDSGDRAEREADAVAQAVMESDGQSAGMASASVAQPSVLRQPKTKSEPQGPYDRMLVENARRRLVLLKQYMAEYTARSGRNTRANAEIKDMREKRAQMDAKGSDLMDKGELEEERMSMLNTKPLKIDVTNKQITFRVRFQVQFEDAKLEDKFGELQSSIQSAVETTWNRRLKGGVLGSRDFVVIPEVTKVASTASRDQTAWLITVRASDKAKVTHKGCVLDQPDPTGLPTSVTDSTCDGGVMNLPPSHIGKPEIIAHEMMHLFGFIDRYRTVEQIGPDKKKHRRVDQLRETGGRPDLLAAGKDPMLVEDLSMLFDKLGVYKLESTRGLDTLKQLEREGMTLGAVTAEIRRQEEIVKTGRDPDGPQPIKKSFMDKVYDSVDEL